MISGVKSRLKCYALHVIFIKKTLELNYKVYFYYKLKNYILLKNCPKVPQIVILV